MKEIILNLKFNMVSNLYIIFVSLPFLVFGPDFSHQDDKNDCAKNGEQTVDGKHKHT